MSQRLIYSSVIMDNGDIFNGKRIGELVEGIINFFSKENLSYAEARTVVNNLTHTMEEYCFFRDASEDNLENT